MITAWNTVMAILIFAVSVRCIRAMDRATDWAIRLSILMIIGGAIAQFVGTITKSWDLYADTLLWGGLLSLLLANNRAVPVSDKRGEAPYIPWPKWPGLVGLARGGARDYALDWRAAADTLRAHLPACLRANWARWSSYAIVAVSIATIFFYLGRDL